MGREETTKPSKRGNKIAALPARFEPRFWEESDQRIARVKLTRRRYQLLKEHGNGEGSFQRDLLCQRAAFISIILETQEVNALEGGAFDVGSYVQGANALHGLLKTLGLERHMKRVGDLKTYLEERDAA